MIIMAGRFISASKILAKRINRFMEQESCNYSFALICFLVSVVCTQTHKIHITYKSEVALVCFRCTGGPSLFSLL